MVVQRGQPQLSRWQDNGLRPDEQSQIAICMPLVDALDTGGVWHADRQTDGQTSQLSLFVGIRGQALHTARAYRLSLSLAASWPHIATRSAT